jgi:hypothetical protein
VCCSCTVCCLNSSSHCYLEIEAAVIHTVPKFLWPRNPNLSIKTPCIIIVLFSTHRGISEWPRFWRLVFYFSHTFTSVFFQSVGLFVHTANLVSYITFWNLIFVISRLGYWLCQGFCLACLNPKFYSLSFLIGLLERTEFSLSRFSARDILFYPCIHYSPVGLTSLHCWKFRYALTTPWTTYGCLTCLCYFSHTKWRIYFALCICVLFQALLHFDALAKPGACRSSRKELKTL